MDHPAADTTYSNVNGTLFGPNGPSYLDVQQGDVGDCWLLASLAEVAARDPEDIRDMFTADGTTVENGVTVNLYKVRFYDRRSGQVRHRGHGTALRRRTYYDQRHQWCPLGGPGREGLRASQRARVTSPPMTRATTTRRLETAAQPNDPTKGGNAAWVFQAITGQAASRVPINPARSPPTGTPANSSF